MELSPFGKEYVRQQQMGRACTFTCLQMLNEEPPDQTIQKLVKDWGFDQSAASEVYDSTNRMARIVLPMLQEERPYTEIRKSVLDYETNEDQALGLLAAIMAAMEKKFGAYPHDDRPEATKSTAAEWTGTAAGSMPPPAGVESEQIADEYVRLWLAGVPLGPRMKLNVGTWVGEDGDPSEELRMWAQMIYHIATGVVDGLHDMHGIDQQKAFTEIWERVNELLDGGEL